MDCSLPGSSLHGILQARVLEWVAISFSGGTSQPRDQTWVSHIPGKRLSSEPPGKPLSQSITQLSLNSVLEIIQQQYIRLEDSFSFLKTSD